ncbi:VWA domain-containing protein [Candidatus Woesearchaeota archaeon]|nr:VWA domain-containing protein [Candidatus Woesearchaeota archaeon]
MVEIVFTRPLFLWFLLSIPLMVITHFYLVRYTKLKAMKFANFEAIRRVSGEKVISKEMPKLVLRVFILLFFIFSAAGIELWYQGYSNDYNFVLAIDASGSMSLDDIKPSRFDAAKEAAAQFVDSLSSQAKMGVVSFAGIAYVDQRLSDNARQTKSTILGLKLKEAAGTSLGDAILTGTNLLLSEDQSRVLILLTDGQENVLEKSAIDTVIETAQDAHITIYTIGMGTEAGSLSILPKPVQDELARYNVSFTLDEVMLQNIAQKTSGQYYRATDKEELASAYTEIASHTKPTQLKKDLSYAFMVIGLLLIFLEWGLVNTRYRLIHFRE